MNLRFTIYPSSVAARPACQCCGGWLLRRVDDLRFTDPWPNPVRGDMFIAGGSLQSPFCFSAAQPHCERTANRSDVKEPTLAKLHPDRAKRLECVELAPAFDDPRRSRAGASSTHSKRSARFGCYFVVPRPSRLCGLIGHTSLTASSSLCAGGRQ